MSEYHLHHYLDKLDYRYNTYKDDDDCTRTIMAIEMNGGKQLMYQ